MAFFEALGVPLKTERGNRVFPVSDKSGSVIAALQEFLKKQKVEIRKEKVDIIPAFTTASCINVAPSVVFLVGALFTTFLGAVGIFLILVGIIMAMASNYKLIGKFVANTTGIVGNLIAAAIVAVVIGVMYLVISGVLTGYVEGPLAENLGAGIEDILGLFLGGGF